MSATLRSPRRGARTRFECRSSGEGPSTLPTFATQETGGCEGYPTGLTLAIVVATAVMASLLQLIDTTIVNVALRQIAGNIGASTTDVAWVITSYAISNVIIIPLSGMLGNLFGRRRYFSASIALFTVASLFCGLSTSLWQLVAWRFLQGIGGGALMATSQTVIMESFPSSRKGVALAIYGIALTMGPAFGPALGGYLTDNYSWQWTFFVNVPLGAATTVLAWFYIGNAPGESRPERMDWWGILFLSLFAGPLQFALEEGPAKDWFASPAIAAALVLAVVALVAFAWRELRFSHPAVDLSLFAARNLSLGVVMTFMLGGVLMGVLYAYPLFTQILLGWDAETSGLSIMPGALATAVGIGIAQRSMRKGASPRVFIVLGFALTALFCLLMHRQSTDSNWSSIFWPMLLRGFALGFVMMPVMNLAVEGLRGKRLAQGNGISNMARQLGGAVGIALLNIRMTHVAAQFRNDMVVRASETNPVAAQAVETTSSLFASKGCFAEETRLLSAKVVDLSILKQTMLLTYLDAFMVVGVVCLAAMPLVFLARRHASADPAVDGDHPIDFGGH